MTQATPAVEPGLQPTAPEAPFSKAYSWYALGLMFVVYIFNFIDRQIINILAEPIKLELGLSDTQIGLLGGVTFAIFYTFLGIPIARLADRGSRKTILAVCLTIWSGMTALCGFAQSFVHLLLCRVGVATGEAGGSPPCHSMISDIFPANRRATALAIYALGIPVGTMLGNLIGGRINDLFDWRTAFIAVGVPGIGLACLVALTLREPPRGASEVRREVITGDTPPVMKVFAALWERRSFRYLSLGAALHAFVGYGVGVYIAPLFIRNHGMATSEIGDALFLLGFAGMAGTFLGGYFGDRLAERDVRWYVWLPGLATLASVPFAAFSYTYGDASVALWVYALPTFLGSYYLGPTFSLVQSLVGLRMRALAASILLFVLNIIGLGLGPVLAGILSDGLQGRFEGADVGGWVVLAPLFSLLPDYDAAEGLRWALVSLLAVNVMSTVLYLMAGRTLKADMERIGELS